MKREKFPFQQRKLTGGIKRGGDVTVLMGKNMARNAENRSQRACRSISNRKARHIGALLRPRTRGDANGVHRAGTFPEQRFHQFRQLLRMVKHRVALPQSQLALPHRKQLFLLKNAPVLPQRAGGGVIARIQAQNFTHGPLPLPQQAFSGRIRAPRLRARR